MANILHVERAANKITLGTTGTTINIASHTASKILALDTSKNLEVVTIGTSLNYARPTLNTIQDIRTTASPEFAALTVTTINGLGVKYTATGNIAIGDTTTLDALDTDPTHNIAIGNGAGSGITNGDDNIFIGYRAGYSHTTSATNIAIGYEASYSGGSIGGITAIGYQAAKYHGTGNGNTCIGYQAGRGDFGGAAYTYNTFIGEMAGLNCNDGGSNVCLGKNAGQHLLDGARNIFLGFDAGHKQTDNSDLLIIDNRERANVGTEITDCLIYGIMAAAPADQTLRINAALKVADKISSATSTFSTAGPTDNVDVSGVNTLFIDTSSNSVTIGGFAGGVDGQVLYVIRTSNVNNVIIEHNEAEATQKIFLHAGADETLGTEYGGWVFVCHGGTDWHDASHAKHVP